jgi:ADP-ribosylglycohydrolase
MCIAPIGVINACDPYSAAYDTFEVASLLHSGMAREAAAATAAAVAEAFKPEATPDSVLLAATAYLTPRSGAFEALEPMLALAKSVDSYTDFTEQFYEHFLVPSVGPSFKNENVPEGYHETVDPMETLGAALGLFYLADGDPVETLIETANFGRDCDSIGAINGSIAGAFKGASALPEKWIRLVDEVNNVDHSHVSEGMYQAVLAHKRTLENQVADMDSLLVNERH